MYEVFRKQPFGMTEDQFEEQKRLLGREPSNYEEFVREEAAAWKGEA